MGLVYLIVAFILSITLHEFMHAFVSDWLGDTTARVHGRLNLNPLAHIDPVMTLVVPAFLILMHSPIIFGAAKPVPFNPWAVRWGKWGVALVAVAGPLTNLALAIFFALWLHFVPLAASGVEFLVTIIRVNVGFAIFNLIPFPPLDGSRVLYAVAPESVRQVMDRIERTGFVGVFVLLIVASPILTPLMAWAMGGLLRVLIPGLTGLSA